MRDPTRTGLSHHSDVLRFIVDYAAEIAAPVRTGVEVTNLSRDEGNGEYSLETTDGQIRHGTSSSPRVRSSAR